jgi:hypothetical protein
MKDARNETSGVCIKCDSPTTNTVVTYILKPKKVETSCLSQNQFSVKYVGDRLSPLLISMCDNCINHIGKSERNKNAILLAVSVFISLILFFVIPQLSALILIIGGIVVLAMLFRFLNSFGNGIKYLKEYIHKENVFSKLTLRLPNGKSIETFHFDIKDTYPTLGGGGKPYTTFKEDQYCLFTDLEINEENYKKLNNREINKIGNMIFEFDKKDEIDPDNHFGLEIGASPVAG